MKRFVAGMLVGLTLAISGVASASMYHTNTIEVRWCPEDAVQIGHGDFDGTRWDWYKCVARDDLGRGSR